MAKDVSGMKKAAEIQSIAVSIMCIILIINNEIMCEEKA